VALKAGGADGVLLADRRDDLPMLFIVSHVDLQAGGENGVEVEVARADGEKCARCWRTVPSVSDRAETEGLCERCIDAVSGAPSRVAG
jgi:isoleucyl-tRNA synthetase